MSEDNAEQKDNKKRKSSADNVTTLRTENMTSGEVLRAAREKRKLTLEDVSAAIHVRAAQLRAIEEGNIDALPGMTYAVGFVKSYASYLKLNPIDLGNKFKAEHGALKPLMPDLPEIKPVVESRMPDPRIVGVAAFFAVVVLIGWTLLGGDDTAGELDIAPVTVAEGEASGVAVEIAPENVTDEVAGSDAAAPAVETSGSPEDVADADDSSAKEQAAAQAKAEEKKAEELKAAKEKEQAEEKAKAEAEEKKEEAEAAAAQEQDSEAAAEDVVAADTAAMDAEAAKKKAAAEAVANVAVQAEAADETITIRKTGRVVFKAKQTSWIQVSDANERVVFKKLLRAGEQYTVPEGKGYTLITTNAGGLDVIVDGKQAPSLGKSGEILRGLPLEPAELTRVKRARSRLNN